MAPKSRGAPFVRVRQNVLSPAATWYMYLKRKRAARMRPEFREETPQEQASDMAGKSAISIALYRTCERLHSDLRPFWYASST